MAIVGSKVKVYIGAVATGKVLAGQRSATLNRSAETIDTTTKDGNGWAESEVGMKSWSIDCDGAFIESDVAYTELEAAFLAGANVEVYVQFPSGAKYAGEAAITDFPLEFPFDDLVTYSISLQGSGALVKTP